MKPKMKNMDFTNNMNIGGDYITDIDNNFADVKNHPAVEMMDSLREG